MKLDQIDISIINQLKDGRAPFNKIAEVAPIDNVAAVETFVVNRSFNLKVPLAR